MADVVIDTSVIVKWYVRPRETGFEQAKALLMGHLAQESRLHIPMLALYEAGNALAHAGSRLPAQERLRHVVDLFSLGLSVHPLTSPIALLALELASTFGVSFYDACFAALAQALGAPLVTADQRLHRQLSALPFIQTLASYRPA